MLEVHKSILVMTAPETGVTVRMYRTGFGDCFLLAFRDQRGAPVYLLIDCGVHSQYKGGGERIRAITSHICASTEGHLHVVAITHEHADHISGFYTAREMFNGMEIDQAWFGWTEKPGDPAAEALKRQRAMMMNALRAAERSLATRDGAVAEGIRGLLGFFELDLGVTGRDALDVIRNKAKNAQYLKPKTRPLTLPGVDGVRVFVLGPPENRKALMAAEPTGEPGEVYEEEGSGRKGVSSDEAFAAALLAASEEPEPAWAEASQPFASNYRVQSDAAKEQKKLYQFFHDHYGFDEGDAEAWRRIDLDWQYAAESLALKLDSATNNTSLVLAIELQRSGRVLLFPGDAQVGNWQSWHKGGWSEENGLGKGETITATNLLNRTVLYKVGHHGSHNATLRKMGLELMVSDQLTAMIPVDESWALDRTPKPWKMPFHLLYTDLDRRTRGRILRTDLGCVEPPPTNPAWSQFGYCPRVEDLYVELTIADE